MKGRDQKVYEEAAALWRELFGEPAPVRTDARTLLDTIMRRLPERSYERMTSPFLRPSQIHGGRGLTS